MMLYDTIIEFGLLFLLVYTPLAFGGVTDYALGIVKIITVILLLVWVVKVFIQRKRLPRGFRPTSDGTQYYVQLSTIPGLRVLCVLAALLLVQRVPLPAPVVNFLSPNTYQLYHEAASSIALEPPQWIPLSVCSQATEGEFHTFLVYLAVFFLLINTIRTSRQIRRMLATIISIGLLESLYGLLQMLSDKHLLFFYPKGGWIQGSFINKNHFAGYLEMVILLAFGVLFTRFEPKSSSHSKTFGAVLVEQYAKTFLWLILLFMMLCALLLSGSRGGAVSLACGLLFFALLARSRRLLRRWTIVVLLFLPLVLILTAIIAPTLLVNHVERFAESELEHSIQIRWEIWHTSWNIFEDFPVFGSGLGTFAHLARRYQTFRWQYRLHYSESDWLQFLAETGLLGVLLLVWLGSIGFSRIFTMWKQRHSRWAVAIVAGMLSALVSLIMHGAVDFNLHIPSNALLFTVIAALSYVTVSMRERQHHDT